MNWVILPGLIGKIVRVQVEKRGIRDGMANAQEWAEIASRKKAIAERA